MTPSESTKIRTVIVDDEELARDRIQTLLELQPDVEIVGVCADGPSAVETIERVQPDLVFLDVQMPGMDGFEVLENLEAERLPAVVFVTAHDGHALRAFEIHALDFLLKPFDQTRFEKALERARSQITRVNSAALDPRLVSLLEELREERKYSERLIVKSSGRVFFVRTEEIDWVEASGRGRLYSYTVVRRPQSEAFAEDCPYVVAAITLDEGPRMTSLLVECDPDGVQELIDRPVEVVWDDVAEGLAMPYFRPV